MKTLLCMNKRSAISASISISVGQVSPAYFSLEVRPSRAFSLGFVISRSFSGAVANYYRRSLSYSIVQKLFLRRSLPHTPAFQRSLWKCVPPVSSLSSSVPSGHVFGAVATYYRWSVQYSIVQKLFLGRYFPHTPALQRSLWKCVPPS